MRDTPPPPLSRRALAAPRPAGRILTDTPAEARQCVDAGTDRRARVPREAGLQPQS